MSLDYIVKVSAIGTDQIDKATEATDALATSATKATAAIKGVGAGTASGMSQAETSLDAANKRLNDQLVVMRQLHEANKITTEQYAKITSSMQRAYDSSLSGDVKALAEAMERVNAPIQRYDQDLQALAISLRKGQLSLEQYDAALKKTQDQAERGGVIPPIQGPAFDPARAGVATGPMAGPSFDSNQAGRGLSEELRREQQLLEQINGPMREYQLQLATLDRLLQKNEIDLVDYNRELDKAQKAAGKGLGPVQGPQPPGAAAAGATAGGGAGAGSGIGNVLQAVAPQFGQGGMLLGQFASGGLAAAAGAAALVYELKSLADEYTTLSNKVQRFATDTMSADDILHQQLDLSKQLHADLAATEELYVRVRESTTELNLSQRQQIAIAHDIGVAIAQEGKGAEDAAALTRRLSLAFESGAISGRELRSIMKQYPEIADGFSAALGRSRNELLQMANKGEISAQQILDAFHRMAPQAEKTLDRMQEGYGQKFGHLWDDIKLSVGRVMDAISEADEDQAKVAEGIYQRHLHAVREAARQLDQELEKNTKTAGVTAAAKSIGIDLGPFSKESADAVTEARMTARQAGIDIADAFEGAKAKAQLYGTEIDKIREQHAAKQIADDARRIYEALYGVDDIMDKGFKRWRDMADQVKTITASIERWKSLTPAGVPKSSDQRDLELQLANVKTDQAVSQYGKGMVTYAQGLNSARAELEAFNRAEHDHVIQGEAARQKYEQLMTTLNDGRLPEAIKIWDELRLPIEQADRDLRALNALWRVGKIDVEEYTAELKKIADTHKNGDAALLEAGIARLNQRFDQGMLTVRSYDAAVRHLTESFATLHRTASGISYRIAPEGPSGPSGLLPNTRPADNLPSVTSSDEMRKIMAQYQSTKWISDATDNSRELNDQFERARQLANEFVAPSVKYEQRLEDITGALRLNSITEEQATAARRRAKDMLNQETEALEAQKGPMEAYAAALRKLKDQLDAQDISRRQYAQGIDKAKETMLQATGAAETLSGAMQINWIKMKQDAEGFGATVANLAVADFGKLNDAIVTAANGGAVSWSQMADSMIQDLERIALKMAEIKLVQGAIGLFSSGGGGDAVGAANAAINSLYGFANGGSYMVGGQGGTDSKFFGARVTPGEMITVQTPSQQSAASRGASRPPPAPVIHNHIHNHYSDDYGRQVITSPGGAAAVHNVMRANAPAIRRALGGG